MPAVPSVSRDPSWPTRRQKAGGLLAAGGAEHLLAQRAANVNGANGRKLLTRRSRVEPGWEIKEHVSDDFELDDDLLEKAEEVVREYERASISLLQRRLRIGYSRAARLIDLLEERGVIGHSEAAGVLAKCWMAAKVAPWPTR